MGKVERFIADTLIDPIADRNANRIRVYRKDNGEIVIHYRNFKIMLISHEEREEWREGFTKALVELRQGRILENDL